MKRMIALLAMGVTLASCAASEMTSGQSYLEKYDYLNKAAPAKNDLKGALLAAAEIEPTLKFPARIGLARIYAGKLTGVPEEESAAWGAVAKNLGSEFGEFVPLSPMVAEMASSASKLESYDARATVMNRVRLGAAAEHVDAVLVYEVYSKSDKKSNFLSIADLTIIGGFILPTKTVGAEGYASAMLIDVMQGYPYGKVEAIVEREEALSSRWGWGSDDMKGELSKQVEAKTVFKLATKVEEMVREVRKKLENKQNKQ